ncbi:MAG: endonuclease NucS [Phycisphaerae bacterium]
MDTYWQQFAEQYVNNPFYWFQPKGAVVSTQTLSTIRSKLKELKRFEGRPWAKAQKAYTQSLRRAGLFKPTKATAKSRDYAAIARMNKKVFDSLGLAWITDESIVQITEAGRQFLQCAKGRLSEPVQNQLKRYEFPNPAVGRPGEDVGVFPYLVALAVLTHFPQGIPAECYELFISRIATPESVPSAVKRVEHYLDLGDRGRKELLDFLDNVPVVKDGRVSVAGRRSSLINTIRLNRSYMLSLLKVPGLVEETGGRLRLADGRHAEAEALVQDHLLQDCYIHFANEEDWVAFYGQTGRRPTFEEALLYYRRRGEVDRATRAFSKGKARKVLPARLQALDESEFRELHVMEKTLEDFLEFNLELLEAGLTFVGRQYPTSTGPLDILAKDRRGRWVVVELKRQRAADKVIGQLLRYRSFIVAERAKGEESSVRGFVVAPKPDKRLIESARGAGGVPLEVFRFVVKGNAKRLYPSRKT